MASVEKLPMLAEGYERLIGELKALRDERPLIVEAIEEARAHGDLSENAEYHAAKERQGQVEMQIAELEDRDGRAAVLEAQVADAASAVVTHEAALASARRAAAPELAAQIEAQLPDLALPNARVAVEVDGAAGA